MPSDISLRSFSQLSISNARQASIDQISTLNFDIPHDVEAARRQITHMGIWDSFIDWAFKGGGKQQALMMIANKVIADQHVRWARENEKSNEDIAALETKQLAIHLEFVGLLSYRGVEAILHRATVSSDFMHCTPDTGKHETDTAIGTIILAHKELMAILFEQRGYGRTALLYWELAEQQSRPNARAILHEQEVVAWLKAENHDNARSAWAATALAYGELAKEASARIPSTSPSDRVELLRTALEAEQKCAEAWGCSLDPNRLPGSGTLTVGEIETHKKRAEVIQQQLEEELKEETTVRADIPASEAVVLP